MKRISMWMLAAILTFCGTSVVTSCSNEDLMEEINEISAESNSHRITAEQAKQNALDFVMNFDATTRANRNNLRVAEVKAVGGNAELTRSIREAVDLDTLFYVVNFANNEGFVIAAADDRENPVFAYVEEGAYYEGDPLNNGFERFMDALIENEIHYRTKAVASAIHISDDGGYGGGYGGRPNKFEVMKPLLVTKWGQWTYTAYCPPKTPTGCVPTAISQICSYLKSPNHVSWSYNGVGGQSPIEWDRIINECSNNFWWPGNVESDDLNNQIAHLMRFWGVAFDADYDSDGTSVDSDDAINKMRKLGYNATKLTDYDATNVMNDLKKGNRIVYMRGNGRYYHVGFVFRKYVDGHAWVVDGYIHSIQNNKESIYLHCNWGWGMNGNNGYFLSDVLNADENPVYNDDGNAMTRSSNFRYKLKTSTFTK